MEKQDNTSQEKSVNSRRKFITSVTAASPVLLTMFSKPASAAVCTISGWVSASPSNVSGITRHNQVQGCGGYSPGGWKTVDNNNSSNDGTRQDWYNMGLAPNPRESYEKNNGTTAWYTHDKTYGHHLGNAAFNKDAFEQINADPTEPTQDPDATMFGDVFSTSRYSNSLYDALLESNSGGHRLEKFAVQTLLSSLYFGWGTGNNSSIYYLDVIGLYNAFVNGDASYKGLSLSGLSATDLANFFEQTQH